MSNCIDFELDNLFGSEGGRRNRFIESPHFVAIKVAKVVSDFFAFSCGAYIVFKLVVFSVDGVIGFVAQMAMFFRLKDSLHQPDYWMAGMPEIKEARGVFVSIAIFDGHWCKDLVLLKRLKFGGCLLKSDVCQDLSADCASCLFG